MAKGASHVTVAFAAAVALTVAGAPAMVDNADGTATQRVRLLPMGTFTTRGKGRFYVKDLAHAQAIVAASVAHAGDQDVPVDYDHQLVYGAVPGVGTTAPASGWVNPATLSAEADGIYGNVEWTKDAKLAIRRKKYKYLSPVIDHDPDGKVKTILIGALTAYPAIDGLTKLAASVTHPQGNPMDLTALAAALDLAATATLDEITAAVTAQKTALTAAQGQITALRAAAGVADGADATAALSAVTALRASAGDTSTTALMAAQQATITRLNDERLERIVDDNLKAGRITPAERPTMLDYLRSNEAAATALMAARPPMLVDTNLDTRKREMSTALSAAERTAARAANLSDEEWIASRNEIEGVI